MRIELLPLYPPLFVVFLGTALRRGSTFPGERTATLEQPDTFPVISFCEVLSAFAAESVTSGASRLVKSESSKCSLSNIVASLVVVTLRRTVYRQINRFSFLDQCGGNVRIVTIFSLAFLITSTLVVVTRH